MVARRVSKARALPSENLRGVSCGQESRASPKQTGIAQPGWYDSQVTVAFIRGAGEDFDMIRKTWILLAAAGLCVCTASASAQSQSLFGNSGPLGQSGASRTSSGTLSTTGRSTTATQGTGGQSGTGSATGIGGQSNTSGSATGGGAQLNELGTLSGNAVGNSTGFVGQTNQGFAGNRLAGQTTAVAPGPTFTLPSGGSFDPSSLQQNNSGQSSTRQIRPRYRVSFDTGTFAPAAVTSRIETQIARLSARTPALAGVTIAINDQGIAELRGTAPDRDTSRLIENIVRLEPGVRGVDNQLDVAQP